MSNNIKKLRKQNKLTQTELVTKLNKISDKRITQATLSRWEKGINTPNKKDWEVLSKIFNVSVPYLQGAYSKEEIIELYNVYFVNLLKQIKNILAKLEQSNKVYLKDYKKLIELTLRFIEAYIMNNFEAAIYNMDKTELENSKIVPITDFYECIKQSTFWDVLGILLNRENKNLLIEFIEAFNDEGVKLENKDKSYLSSISRANSSDEDTKLVICAINKVKKTVSKIKNFMVEFDKTNFKINKQNSNHNFLFSSRAIKWLLKYPNIDISKEELFELFDEIGQNYISTYIAPAFFSYLRNS